MKGKSAPRSLCGILSLLIAILQRVTSASVTIDTKLVASIGKGILVLAAVAKDDARKDAESLASKVLKMKMWPDDDGKGVITICAVCHSMRLSSEHSGRRMYKISAARCYVVSNYMMMSLENPTETNGTVSQFTLLAATDKGNKPDFHRAASVEHAKDLYDRFVEKVQELHTPGKTQNGVFQAMMEGEQ